MEWKRVFDSPYLAPEENTVAPAAVTTPDCLSINGELEFYIGGVEAGRERIIHSPLSHFDLEKPATGLLASATVALHAGPGEFDCYHVYDPATLFLDGKIYLFYSAIGTGPDSIGLAISENGEEFQKFDHPVLIGRAPEVVWLDGRFHLFYVLKSDESSYQIFSSITEDLKSFQDVSKGPILKAGLPGCWDGFEVTTPRVFKRGKMYYLLYAGSRSSHRKDMPEAFGLARSKDLIHWEKYPQNPVFSIGRPGHWDDGAIWFGTVFEWNNQLNLIYEGGRLADIENHTPAITQVGLARISCIDFDQAAAKW